MILHLALHAAAVLLVAWSSPASTLAVLASGAGSVAAAGVARTGRLRPVSDILAWAGAIACFAFAESPHPTFEGIAAAGIGMAAMVIALHHPPRQAPSSDIGVETILVALAAAVATAAAWGSVLLREDRLVLVQDSMTTAGMAVRLIAVSLVAGLIASMAGVLRRRRKDDPPGTEAVP